MQSKNNKECLRNLFHCNNYDDITSDVLIQLILIYIIVSVGEGNCAISNIHSTFIDPPIHFLL